MYGYNYSYTNPQYNQQNYLNELQNMRDKIDKQMAQLQQPIQTQPTNLTQNFQLATNQSNNNLKNAENLEEVKKELVFNDTLFINKDYTKMWLKQISGGIKEYEIREIPIFDEKDKIIVSLKAKIEELEKGNNNYEPTNANVYVNEPTTSTKSSNGANDKSSKK